MRYVTERENFYEPHGARVIREVHDHLSPNGTPFDSRIYVAQLARVLLQRKSWNEAGDVVGVCYPAAARRPKLTLTRRATR